MAKRKLTTAETGIKSKERVKQYGEVFTQPKHVSMMCDMLQDANPDCYSPEWIFLEPCCGEGVFCLEVLRRKFANCKTKKDCETAALSVWGMDIQADNVEITTNNVLTLCREHFKVSKDLEKEIRMRYMQCDSLKVMHLLGMYQGGMLVHALPPKEESA